MFICVVRLNRRLLSAILENTPTLLLEDPNWRIRRDTTRAELSNDFASPSAQYLPYAYWFWADVKPDPAVYRRVASELTGGGYALLPQDRGFRADVETFMSCFDAAVEESKKAGMYLEYCERAGCQREKPEHYGHTNMQGISLACTPVDLQPGQTVRIADNFFTVTASPTAAGSIDSDTLQLVTGETFTAHDTAVRLYGFTTYTAPPHEGVYNNFLCSRTSQWLFDMTHARIFERYPDELGKTVAGYFFDLEGDYGDKMCWSDELAEEYSLRTGRDIRLYCPLLLEEDAQGKWMRARYDYLDAVSEVYARFTFGELSDRLEEKGMFMGGHVWEEYLLGQVLLSGDPMRIYRAMSMPSNDQLDIAPHNVRTHKELQSVCELDGKRAGCEILSISGWETDSSDLHEAVNNAVTHSISHFILHSVYSNRDEIQKAGYAQDFFDWAPMWNWNRSFVDYMHRTSWMISQGRMVTDVLLYNPIESVWALVGDAAYDTGKNFPLNAVFGNAKVSNCFAHSAEIQRIDDEYIRAVYDLTAARVSFLIGDRYYVDRATVRDGRLHIGEHSFMTVVVPSVCILSLTVAEKLWALLEDGGYVLFTGTLPCASAENGMNDPLMQEWMERIRKHPGCTVASHLVCAGVGVSSYIGCDMLPAVCSFAKGEFALHVQHRIIDGHSFYWLANNHRKVQNCALRFPGQHGRAFLWDVESGERRAVPSADESDGSVVPLVFEASQGFFLEFDPELPVFTETPAPFSGEITVTGDWRLRIDRDRQPRPTGYDMGVPDALYAGITSPLMDWQDLGIPHFSGCMEYEKTFVLPCDTAVLEIDLGKVNYMAKVSLDGGQEAERLWGPYRFRFTDVPAGSLVLHVRVGNLMSNALAPHQWETEHGYWHAWDPKPETFRSGLFGPVVVRYR